VEIDVPQRAAHVPDAGADRAMRWERRRTEKRSAFRRLAGVIGGLRLAHPPYETWASSRARVE